MATQPDQVPADLIARYQAAIDTQPEVELKGAQKLPHTSTNGRMYSSLTKDGRMGLRLPDDEREAFMAEHDAVPFTNYGANIAEHVEVPDALLDQPAVLGEYLERSRQYTESLPSK